MINEKIASKIMARVKGIIQAIMILENFSLVINKKKIHIIVGATTQQAEYGTNDLNSSAIKVQTIIEIIRCEDFSFLFKKENAILNSADTSNSLRIKEKNVVSMYSIKIPPK